jgi:hypothetical protein
MEDDGRQDDVPERSEVPWLHRVDAGGEGEAPERTERWSRPTRQQQGRLTEKKILSKLGAWVHPNSGAGRIKDDGSDDENLYEIKDANKVISITADELEKLRRRAAAAGLEPVFIVEYEAHDITILCHIRKR